MSDVNPQNTPMPEKITGDVEQFQLGQDRLDPVPEQGQIPQVTEQTEEEFDIRTQELIRLEEEEIG